jgi:hypothetical protein
MVFFARTWAAVLTMLLASNAMASIQIETPIKPSSDLRNWVDQLKTEMPETNRQMGLNPDSAFFHCRISTDNLSLHICIAPTAVRMNQVLVRATVFAEGSFGRGTKGKVVSTNHPRYADTGSQFFGHDLTGQDLLRFYNSALAECHEGKQESCLSNGETEFFEQFVAPRAQADPNFILIAFSIESSIPWSEAASHELLHARYFLEENYRNAIDEFWEKHVLPKDKELLRFILSGAYDPSDEVLIRNEFQAYLMMKNADASLLKIFGNRYRPFLIKHLRSYGALPPAPAIEDVKSPATSSARDKQPRRYDRRDPEQKRRNSSRDNADEPQEPRCLSRQPRSQPCKSHPPQRASSRETQRVSPAGSRGRR